ncbi:anti-sigma factor [Nakamurella sp. YIM 132087]|uniref:Anti-sigma factor n=1 Tax=Nakamurella alba TaxID=2665158 RepID=A0A7K1FT97_9ACTN|nr:zf-HC2 domain-containing protein [Nakamurella alba]MTD17358.1 anti-sigma factor [Nakamurella alba]
MNDSSHRELRELLAWYATGRADAVETAAVEAHLDGCPECRAELAELRGTVRALDLVDVNRIEALPAPPPELRESVLELGRETSSPRRSRTPLLLAAAVAVLLVGGVLGWVLRPQPEVVAGPPTEPVAVQVDQASLNASAELINHTWGVEIQLTATGFVPGEAYRVRIVTTDGDRSPAGEFVGTGSNSMECNLNSAVLRPDAAGFEVLSAEGAVVLTSTF